MASKKLTQSDESLRNACHDRLRSALFSGDFTLARSIISENLELVKDTLNDADLRLRPLYVASRGNDHVATSTVVAFVRDLVESLGADVNLKEVETGSTALHVACYRSQLDVIVYLRSHGANIEALNNEYDTPLADACASFHPPLRRALAYKLAKGIIPSALPSDAAGDANEPIHMTQNTNSFVLAIQNFDRGTLETQCKGLAQSANWMKHALLDAQSSPDALTPLHMACAVVNVDAIKRIVALVKKALVDKAADSFLAKLWATPDNDGWTPLHWLLARFVHLEDASLRNDVLELLQAYRTPRFWSMRVASRNNLRHPLLFQTFLWRVSPHAPATVVSFLEPLSWPYNLRSERIFVRLWAPTRSTSATGEELEAFYTRSELRRVRIVRVRNIIEGKVSGTPLCEDLTVSLGAHTLRPLSSLSSTSLVSSESEFRRVPSLLAQYFLSDGPDASFRTWAIGDIKFSFARLISVTAEGEKYEVIVQKESNPKVRAELTINRVGLIDIDRTDNTLAAEGSGVEECGSFQSYDLRDLCLKIHDDTFFPSPQVCLGTTAHHWAAEYCMPDVAKTLTSNAQTLGQSEWCSQPVTNIPSAAYLAYEAKPGAWESDLFKALGLRHECAATAHYLVNCACAVGDSHILSSILEHFSSLDLINTCRTVGKVREYPIVLAAKFGHLGVVRDLVEKYKANVSVENGDALKLSIAGGYMQVAEYLLPLHHSGISQLPRGSQLPSVEEVDFVIKHNLLSADACESVINENVVPWCKTVDGAGAVRTALVFVCRGEVNPAHTAAQFAVVAQFLKDSSQMFVSLFLDADDDGSNSAMLEAWSDLAAADIQIRARQVVVPAPSTSIRTCFFDDKARKVESSLLTRLRDQAITNIVICGSNLNRVVSSAHDALRVGFDVSILGLAPSHVTDLANRVHGSGARFVDACGTSSDRILRRCNLLTHHAEYTRTKSVSYAIRRMLNRTGVRLHVLFEDSVGAVRMLKIMDGFSFGNEPRNGEIFLYFALLCAREHQKARESCIEYLSQPSVVEKLQRGEHVTNPFDITLHGFSIEGLAIESGDFQSLQYPLHYLMMRAKHSPSKDVRACALRLLEKCITFIQQEMDISSDVLATKTRMPGISSVRDLAHMHPAGVCDVDDILGTCYFPSKSSLPPSEATSGFKNYLRCKCIFHVPLRVEKSSPAYEMSLVCDPRTLRTRCSHAANVRCGVFTNKMHAVKDEHEQDGSLVHVLCCPPLALAVRLGLPSVVRLILSGGVRSIGDMSGRDYYGDMYTYENLTDDWQAFDPTGRTCPVLHWALTRLQLLSSHMYNDGDGDPFLATYTPGCALPDPDAPSTSIAEGSGSGSDAFASPEFRWYLPVWRQWCCPDCGVYPSPSDQQRHAVDDGYCIIQDRAALHECVTHLMRASLVRNSRQVTINGEPQTKVVLRLGEAKETVRSFFDRGGVFLTYPQLHEDNDDYRGSSTVSSLDGRVCTNGLSLVLQYAPDLIDILIDAEFLDLIDDAAALLRDNHSVVGLIRRHLWTACRGGTQVLVIDRNLTLLHWAALHGNVRLIKHLQERCNDAESHAMLVSKTDILGYSALHYACYGGSTDVLRMMLTSIGDVAGARGVQRKVNEPAWPKLITEETVLTRNEMEVVGENILLGEDSVDARRKPNTLGETCAHICAAFGHKDCLLELLNYKADMEAKTFLEDMDAHDIALALQRRHEIQLFRERLQPATGEDVKSPEDVERDEKIQGQLDEVVHALQDTPEVKRKLLGYSYANFFRTTWTYVFFVICLLTFTLLLSNVSAYKSPFLTLTAVRDKITGEEFAIDFHSPSPTATSDPPLGTQFRANMEDVGEAEDTGEWLTKTLRRVLFAPVDDNNMNASRVVVDSRFLLMGSVRVYAQRAVKGKYCTLRDYAKGFVPECYAALSGGNLDETDLVVSHDDGTNTTIPFVKWGHSKFASRYISPGTELMYTRYRGNVVDIPSNIPQSELDAKFTEIGLMVGSATRAIVVHAVLYNPSEDVFVTCELLFELPVAGGAHVRSQFLYIRGDYYDGGVDTFRLILEVLVLLFVVQYMHEELVDAAYTAYNAVVSYRVAQALENTVAESVQNVTHRFDVDPRFRARVVKRSRSSKFVSAFATGLRAFQSHVFNDWNSVDIVIIVLLVASAVLHVIVHTSLRDIDVEQYFRNANDSPFPDTFHGIANTHTTELKLLSVAVLFSCVKLLKYVRLMPVLGPVAVAIGITAAHRSIFSFVLVFAIVVMGFVLSCYIAFSPFVEGIRSFKMAFFFVFRMVIGDADFDALFDGDEYLGPFIWFVVVTFVGILLLNILIAIVGNVYDEVLPDAEALWHAQIATHYCDDSLRLPNLQRPHGDFFLTPWLKLLGRAIESVRAFRMSRKVFSRKRDHWAIISERVLVEAELAEQRRQLTNADLMTALERKQI